MRNEILERHAGKGFVLYMDCSSGLSGDMILSSLIDLGVPLSIVEDSVSKLPLNGCRVRTASEKRNSVDVTRFFVDVESGSQPHRHFSDIRDMISESDLDAETKNIAISIFFELAKAEASVHGTEVDDVHFHEVGAVDSIVDIVGAACAFTYLGADVVCGTVPLGRGFVDTEHGILPLPAPATLLILNNVPVEGTSIEAELTTPTGAAIVKTMAKAFGPIPRMNPLASGFGAGSRSHPTRPGILRTVLGKPDDHSEQTTDCWVIEANIDDMSGELAASAMETTLNKGALDAWCEPIQMKKGRPAWKLCLLVNLGSLTSFCEELLKETSTIGLRYYRVGRKEMNREFRNVETPWGPVKVKISRSSLGASNAAPEFEDCKALSSKTGVPLKRIMAVASGLAQQFLENE